MVDKLSSYFMDKSHQGGFLVKRAQKTEGGREPESRSGCGPVAAAGIPTPVTPVTTSYDCESMEALPRPRELRFQGHLITPGSVTMLPSGDNGALFFNYDAMMHLTLILKAAILAHTDPL